MTRVLLSIALLGCTMLISSPAFACATCFGAQDSPQTQGMNMAIIAMLGTTYTLFAAMFATAFFLWRKARREIQANADDQDPTPDLSDGDLSHG